MKSDFKTKLIQHMLNKKNGEKGFTLIELLVVIIIIGILAAIALPSFLNQANKARESEAKTYTGSMNRGQQAYFLEQRTFASGIGPLGLGLNSATANYNYFVSVKSDGRITGSPAASGGETNLKGFVNAYGAPINAALKGFAGTTYVASTTGGESTTIAGLCGTKVPHATAVTNTSVDGYASAPSATITGCINTNMENLDK